MNTDRWQHLLADARNAEEVVAVVRHYIASLDAESLAKLPEWCRVRTVQSIADIQVIAYDLAHLDRKLDAPDAVVQAIGAFFAVAATRIARLSISDDVRDKFVRLFQ